MRRPAHRALPSATLVVALVFSALVGLPALASATTTAEKAFVDEVNGTRTAQGLPALVVNTKLAEVARGWSATMGARNTLSHRPSLGAEVSRSVTPDWSRVGENVGYTTNSSRQAESVLVDRIHAAFMASPGHRDNILGGYNQVGVGVVVSGNGTMWVTVNFMQAPISATVQTPAPAPGIPTFASWTRQAAPTPVSAPGAVSWGDGRADLFAIDASGRLVHRFRGRGGSWAPAASWENLGSPPGIKLVGQPSAASQRAGSLDVVARGADNAVWHLFYRPGKGWSRWSSLGGVITHSPSAVSWADGRLDVFATSPNGKIYHRWHGGRWSSWSAIGTATVASAPSVISWARGRLDVFARGHDGTLRHTYYGNNRWGRWESLGGALLGGGRPEAVAWGPGRLDVFVIGTNAALYRTHYQAGSGWMRGFSALDTAGGGLLTGTTALTDGPGHLHVFATARDGAVWGRVTH